MMLPKMLGLFDSGLMEKFGTSLLSSSLLIQQGARNGYCPVKLQKVRYKNQASNFGSPFRSTFAELQSMASAFPESEGFLRFASKAVAGYIDARMNRSTSRYEMFFENVAGRRQHHHGRANDFMVMRNGPEPIAKIQVAKLFATCVKFEAFLKTIFSSVEAIEGVPTKHLNP